MIGHFSSSSLSISPVCRRSKDVDPGHENAALRLRLPGDHRRSGRSFSPRTTATPRRSPAARAWCRCSPSACRSRRCWSTCASSPICAEIRISDRGVTLGAMVRWRDIEDDERLATAHPLLKAAIAHVAHYQIRNRGTVGGSIAHADPAAEMPGIAMTCDAEIAVVGKSGARVITGGRFLPGPADDRAHARRDHHRNPPAGLAGAPALGVPGIRPPPRRFRHGGGGRLL